ncbi:putative glucuronosyltransferase [Helianthus annuus]|nr:putative glucuronosyltransferase [Helianthus annuus]
MFYPPSLRPLKYSLLLSWCASMMIQLWRRISMICSNAENFCANLKNSERLNSGVMLVQPSKELSKDMVTKVTTLYSYGGGVRGTLAARLDLNSPASDFWWNNLVTKKMSL